MGYMRMIGLLRWKVRCWGMINAARVGTKTCPPYLTFDFRKYADRYLAEVQYRFNRRFDLGTILKRLVRAAAITTPCPEAAIRAAEACN